MGLDLRLQVLRFGTNAGGTRLDSLAVFENGLQIDVLFGLGSDIGVAAGEAIHSSAAADGTCSCHPVRQLFNKWYMVCQTSILRCRAV